jgi:hypothetical protein
VIAPFLLLTATATTTQAQPPEDPIGVDPNAVIAVNTSALTPSPQQHINFILEEHGYDIRVPESVAAPSDPVAPPRACLLVQFRLEEHGYDIDYPCD